MVGEYFHYVAGMRLLLDLRVLLYAVLSVVRLSVGDGGW